MAKKKKTKKLKRKSMPKEQEVFYVGISDPGLLRKTVLEAARDTVQGLQQFEKFKSIRAQKHDMIMTLKGDVQSLRSLLGKLRKSLPKTKLRVKLNKGHTMIEEVKKEVVAPKPKETKPKLEKPKTGLERLEAELDSIEDQLSRLS